MNTTFSKRLCAFLIDALIVFFVSSVMVSFIPQNDNVAKLQKEFNEYTDMAQTGEITMDEYISKSVTVRYNLDKNLVPYSIISILICIIYYVVFAFYRESKTVGRQLMKIKVVRDDGEKIQINDLLIRTIFAEGLFVSLISLALLYVLKPYGYFLSAYGVEGIYIIILIIISFMILYRKDKRSFHDIITKTSVKE